MKQEVGILIEDGSSISKGVEVLSRVNSEINCVFLHLLENPTLCDRRAVKTATAGEESNERSPNPTASTQRQGVPQETRVVSIRRLKMR
jgi:hypothetical protein